MSNVNVYSHNCRIRGMPIKLHRAMAEDALGKFLPKGTAVHHADGDHSNNVNSNLVICPDESYHNLLHMRLEAYRACGNPDAKKCYICKDYDDESKLLEVRKAGRRVTTFYHSACRQRYRKQYRQETGRHI